MKQKPETILIPYQVEPYFYSYGKYEPKYELRSVLPLFKDYSPRATTNELDALRAAQNDIFFYRFIEGNKALSEHEKDIAKAERAAGRADLFKEICALEEKARPHATRQNRTIWALFYSYWEDFKRKEIAKQRGIK